MDDAVHWHVGPVVTVTLWLALAPFGTFSLVGVIEYEHAALCVTAKFSPAMVSAAFRWPPVLAS